MTAQQLQFAPRNLAFDGPSDSTDALDRLAVVDLVHLSRQTLGDSALETELLALFQNQAQQFAKRLLGPSHPGDEKWRAELAHTLKGSARAVGAFKVAQAAENYETAINSRAANIDAVLLRLAEAIDETRREIAGLLERV